MNVIPFLEQLRAMLTPTTAWHPLACANVRGRMLGEYEQLAPTAEWRGLIESTPVAWNLPCAVTYLLQQWEHEGCFRDIPLEKQALRRAVEVSLDTAAGGDFWNITDHADALAVLDAALSSYARSMAATTLPTESAVGTSPSSAVPRGGVAA